MRDVVRETRSGGGAQEPAPPSTSTGEYLKLFRTLRDSSDEFKFPSIAEPLGLVYHEAHPQIQATAFECLVQIAKKEIIAGRIGGPALHAARLFLFRDHWAREPTPDAFRLLDGASMKEELEAIVELARNAAFDPTRRKWLRESAFHDGQYALELLELFR